MLIIRGVNVFPSQIESILVGIKGASPHYILEVDRINSTDALTVKVEMAPDMDVDAISSIENLRNTIADQIKSVVGIKAKVQLVAPKSIARSEGKAKRVIDKRKL
jgi:phenylacetate-CoA ligase